MTAYARASGQGIGVESIPRLNAGFISRVGKPRELETKSLVLTVLSACPQNHNAVCTSLMSSKPIVIETIVVPLLVFGFLIGNCKREGKSVFAPTLALLRANELRGNPYCVAVNS